MKEEDIEKVINELSLKRGLKRPGGIERALQGEEEYLEELVENARSSLGVEGNAGDPTLEGDYLKRLALHAREVAKPKVEPDLINTLIEDLGASEPETRRRAVAKLGKMGERVLPKLTEALIKGDKVIRSNATLVFGIIGGRAVDELITLLTNDDWDVRRRAARALGWIGDPLAVTVLKERLQDENPYVSLEAEDSLSILARDASKPRKG